MTKTPRAYSLVWLYVACAVVLLSRLPFLAPGYGNDRDAWLTATAARLISETGVYHESRVPGHPVQEWICSLLWRGGPRARNGATAVASARAAPFFGLSFAELGGKGRWPGLAALALSFTPVVYIHSVDTMDYLWALCFSMAALWLVVEDRWLLAGIALGLAIGSRVTAGLLLVPLAIAGSKQDGWKARPGALAGFVVVSLLVGGATYLPRIAQYGIGPAMLSIRGIPYPGVIRLLQNMTLEIWGTIGGFGLIAALCFGLARRGSASILPRSRAWLGVEVLVVALYLTVFFRLPDEAGYLIPIVPFVLLSLARVLKPAAFAAACLCLIASPFAFDLGRPENTLPGDIALPSAGHPLVVLRPSEGPLFVEHRQRLSAMRNGEALLSEICDLQGPALVVCAQWMNQLYETSQGTLPHDVHLTEYLANAGQADSVLRSGARLYYVHGADHGSLYYYHLDLDSLGARPLRYVPTR